MNMTSRIGRMAAIVASVGTIALPALAQDGRSDAQMHISGGSVAFLAGVSWGHGRVEYHGRSYRVKVRGLKVGSIGAASFNARGDVFHLRRISDIDGTYGTADASATMGAGAGAVTLHNDKGVVINMTSTSEGLQLTAAPGGVELQLE
jgi:hypothetical protein